jgi:hypothetical protein
VSNGIKIIHISSVPPFYRFDGIFFEVHRYFGPYPLNNDGDPRGIPPGRRFWRMWEKFSKLSPADKEKYKK